MAEARPDPVEILSRLMTSARADQVTRRADPDAFARGRDCHVVVHEAAEIAVPVPVLANGAPVPFEIAKPAGVPIPLDRFPDRLRHPDLTISRLSGAICVPGGVAIARSGIVLDESFSAYWERYRHYHLDIPTPRNYRVAASYSGVRVLPGRYVFLDSESISHFGHFLLDVATRLWAFEVLQDRFGIGDLKVLISRKDESFIFALLEIFGVPPDAIVQIDEAVACEELFVATKALQIQEYAAPAATAVWERVARRAGEPPPGYERVFFSRAHNHLRRLEQGQAVEAIFAEFGFRIVHPEQLPFRDQVRIAAGAELAAGPSGSNLFDLAFGLRLRSTFVLSSPLLVLLNDVLLQAGRPRSLRLYVGTLDLSDLVPGSLNVNHPWHIPNLDDLRVAIEGWLAAET